MDAGFGWEAGFYLGPLGRRAARMRPASKLRAPTAACAPGRSPSTSSPRIAATSGSARFNVATVAAGSRVRPRANSRVGVDEGELGEGLVPVGGGLAFDEVPVGFAFGVAAEAGFLGAVAGSFVFDGADGQP